MTSKTRQTNPGTRQTRRNPQKKAFSRTGTFKSVQHYVDTITLDHVRGVTAPTAKTGKMGNRQQKSPEPSDPTLQPTGHQTRIEIRDAVIWNGETHFLFQRGERSKWISGNKFAFDDKAGLRELKDAGIVHYGPKATRALIDEIEAVTDFRTQVVIDQCGWTSPHFTLQDGHVTSPLGGEPPPVVISAHPDRVATHGSYVAWRRQVAALFAGHPIGEFMLSVAFAPN